MAKNFKRNFSPGEKVFVVDYCCTRNGTRASEAEAHILEINKLNHTFVALLYGDTLKRYSYKDYGRLIFDTKSEAYKAAEKLPKPDTEIYQLRHKKLLKKKVLGIYGEYINNVFDLVVCFNKGKYVSVKNIGVSLFFSEDEAKAHLS